jgi:hypothetical protein
MAKRGFDTAVATAGRMVGQATQAAQRLIDGAGRALESTKKYWKEARERAEQAVTNAINSVASYGQQIADRLQAVAEAAARALSDAANSVRSVFGFRYHRVSHTMSFRKFDWEAAQHGEKHFGQSSATSDFTPVPMEPLNALAPTEHQGRQLLGLGDSIADGLNYLKQQAEKLVREGTTRKRMGWQLRCPLLTPCRSSLTVPLHVCCVMC